MMHWIQKDGIPYLQFPRLSQVAGVRHAVFLRFSNNEQGSRQSFNLGLNCGDRDDLVWDHRRQAKTVLGLEAMVLARQLHSDQVRTWPAEDLLEGPKLGIDHVSLAGDALVTALPGHALFIQTADCQSVFIADPHQSVVANIHCGWRGSISNIIGRTVDLMAERYSCRREDMRSAIGPSLGPCCAEFINYRTEIPGKFWHYKLAADHFDFWRISLDQLVASGVPEGQVEISHICTRCNPHLFYSYRGERRTGRFAAVIGLEPR